MCWKAVQKIILGEVHSTGARNHTTNVRTEFTMPEIGDVCAQLDEMGYPGCRDRREVLAVSHGSPI